MDEEGLLYFASLGKTEDMTDHYLSFGNYLEAMVVTASNWSKISNSGKDFMSKSHDQGDIAHAQDLNVKMSVLFGLHLIRLLENLLTNDLIHYTSH